MRKRVFLKKFTDRPFNRWPKLHKHCLEKCLFQEPHSYPKCVCLCGMSTVVVFHRWDVHPYKIVVISLPCSLLTLVEGYFFWQTLLLFEGSKWKLNSSILELSLELSFKSNWSKVLFKRSNDSSTMKDHLPFCEHIPATVYSYATIVLPFKSKEPFFTRYVILEWVYYIISWTYKPAIIFFWYGRPIFRGSNSIQLRDFILRYYRSSYLEAGLFDFKKNI